MGKNTGTFYQGFATVLAELITTFDQPSMVPDIMRRYGVTLDDLRRGRVIASDIATIRHAMQAAPPAVQPERDATMSFTPNTMNPAPFTMSPPDSPRTLPLATAFPAWHCHACNRTVTHGGYHDCKGGTVIDPATMPTRWPPRMPLPTPGEEEPTR